MAAERPAPMDAAELAEVVSRLARAGSVQAAKLRWQMLQAGQPEPAEGDILDELDEVARLRDLGLPPTAVSMKSLAPADPPGDARSRRGQKASQASMSWAFHASKTARTISTFSCDIGYSDSPAASRASALVR